MCKDEISLQGNALFAVKATACLVAWQRPEGKLWLLKSVGHKFVLGSANVLLCSGASQVSLHMESKVVWPWEGPVTFLTLEWPVACVFPVVACELVRTCKLPTTALPVAVVRLLPFDGNTIHTEQLVLALRLNWPNLPHLEEKRSPSCPAASV